MAGSNLEQLCDGTPLCFNLVVRDGGHGGNVLLQLVQLRSNLCLASLSLHPTACQQMPARSSGTPNLPYLQRYQ